MVEPGDLDIMPSKELNRPWRHLYNSKWNRARARYLINNPLCIYCLQAGKVTIATVVDHIEPHKGNEHLFWSVSNWQALCDDCHNQHKAKQEYSGVVPGHKETGEPIDANHPWNK